VQRLVLFDIDETMVSSHGAGRRALEKAMTEVLKRPISCEGHSLSGKTDPQICFEVLSAHGVERDAVERLLPDIFEVYLPALVVEVDRSAEFKIHAGVVDLLERLQAHDEAYLGLLTGNIEPGARVKLGKFQLNDYFSFGAFGSDAHNRMDLPAVAHRRAQDIFKCSFAPEELVIIGDARNDVLCAQGYGAKAVAVCTGKTTKETLAELKPDHLFDSLEDTCRVLDAIFAN
jgi:phosphoglycolate phosphatase-like HAD superfamily hydrolase